MGMRKKIVILLVILSFIGAGLLVYRTFRSSGGTDDSTTKLPVDNSVDQVKQAEFNNAIIEASVSDQDLDGVSDIDEAKYKTNPASSDTDEDGLTDWQEIFNFKTDPLKSDTDGDGVADGYEVRHGTNPNIKEK